jgi:hypothetical protein
VREAAAKTVTVPVSFAASVEEDEEDGEDEELSEEEEQALRASRAAMAVPVSCRVRRFAERFITGFTPSGRMY